MSLGVNAIADALRKGPTFLFLDDTCCTADSYDRCPVNRVTDDAPSQINKTNSQINQTVCIFF